MKKLTYYRVKKFKEKADYQQSSGKTIRLFKLYLSVTIPLQEKHDFASQIEKLKELKSQIFETLKQIGLSMRPLDVDDLIEFYDKVLISRLSDDDYCSPIGDYDPLLPLRYSMPSQNRKVEVQKDGLLIDEGASIFRSYSILKYPMHWNQSQMGSLIGDFYSDLQQIESPFFIHYGVNIPKQSDLTVSITAKASHLERQINSPIAKFLPKMRDELNEYQFVARQLSEGHRVDFFNEP